MAAQRKSKIVSIQAHRKRAAKGSMQDLHARTLRKASRQGMKWEDDEVSRMVAGIERDETTFEMAMALGRSLYATQSTRRMVAFALRHKSVLF